MDKFHEKHNLTNSHKKETDDLNRSISTKKIESIINNFPKPGPDGFTGEFYQTFKKEIYNPSYRIKAEGILSNTFYETSISQYQNYTRTQVQLPATVKAKLLRQVLMKRTVVCSDTSNVRRWETHVPKPSSHLSAGRGFYKEGEGKQHKEIKGMGLKSSLRADQRSPF